MSDTNPPEARLEPRRGGPWPWLLPVGTLLFAGFLAWQVWGRRGPTVTVHAAQGHGVKAGDALRYRGITVGEVRTVELSADLQEVLLRLELVPAAQTIARAGSHFWIVRPHVTLDGVTGLETVVGARYLEVLPGAPDAPPQYEFVALAEPPLVEMLEPGALEVILEAPERHGIRAGAPVTYRDIQIGAVLSVGLSSDATTVEMRVSIRPDYAALVRADTRFWEVSGLELEAGLMGGLSLELGSLRSLLVGAVALATPEGPGEPASTEHRFPLSADPEPEWKRWRPHLPVGHALLPPGRVLPRPTRATRSWRGGLFRRRREVQAWSLFTSGGLVGPEELLRADDARQTTLEAIGSDWLLEGEPARQAHGLALRELDAAAAERWPLDESRLLAEPEACLIVGDPANPPMPIAAAWLAGADGSWTIDRSVPLDQRWHGASVVARSDGKLVGLLLFEDHDARIAPLP